MLIWKNVLYYDRIIISKTVEITADKIQFSKAGVEADEFLKKFFEFDVIRGSTNLCGI